MNMKNTLDNLSTSTPASEVSSKDFDDGYNSEELGMPSLDDILRNSPMAEKLGLKQESLPDEDSDVSTPDGESDEDPDAESSADSDTEESVEEDTESEKTDEDEQDSTQEADLPSEEDIDWEYKVPVKIDGKLEYITLEEIRKGYATDKHLSQKGRELGELRKQLEEERTTKLNELVQLGSVLHYEMTSAEQQLGKEYHDLSKQIEKAQEENDLYTARELKEKRDSVQEKYWATRNKREQGTVAIVQQIKAKREEEQQRLLHNFQSNIKEVVPEWDDEGKLAKSIRDFALSEGLDEEVLNQIYDPVIVRMLNDYRKLKTAKATGVVKRKNAPISKSIPSKKGTPVEKKQQAAAQVTRQKVLTGQASDREQMDFLKSISSVSRKL